MPEDAPATLLLPLLRTQDGAAVMERQQCDGHRQSAGGMPQGPLLLNACALVCNADKKGRWPYISVRGASAQVAWGLCSRVGRRSASERGCSFGHYSCGHPGARRRHAIWLVDVSIALFNGHDSQNPKHPILQKKSVQSDDRTGPELNNKHLDLLGHVSVAGAKLSPGT
jgi:hypothetical protein